MSNATISAMQKLTDTNNRPINPGDTLELLEDEAGSYKGDRYLVSLQRWDEDDTEDSLVAIIQPRGFLTILLNPERSKNYKVID